MVNLLRSSIPSTIKIKENISENCSFIDANPIQLHQIVMNLCTNAYQAMAQSGGTLSIELKEIELTEKDIKKRRLSVNPGTYIEILVGDTGVGIDPEIKSQIFDPFFTTKGVGEGTGMGLSVVHGIVTDHGGAIVCESEVGVGTTFYVLFSPISERTFKPSEDLIPQSKTVKGTEHILLVDDEAPLVEIGERHLKKLGYSVTGITSSVEALKLFISNPSRFDLIITDQTMPEMTGTDLARELLEIRPEIPIILCTGYSSMVSKDEALAIGIREFIFKPVAQKDLDQSIQRVLDS